MINLAKTFATISLFLVSLLTVAQSNLKLGDDFSQQSLNAELQNAAMIFYPNPVQSASGIINVGFSNVSPEVNIKIVVKDLNGRNLQSVPVRSDYNGNAFAVVEVGPGLDPGLYLLTGYAETDFFSEILVIK